MQILHVFGTKGDLEGGNVVFFVHNLSDLIAHHTGGTIMHDGWWWA